MSFVQDSQAAGPESKQRLLLVVQNPVLSECFQEISERYVEYEVVVTTSLEEASAFVATEVYSLIIIDILGSELCSPKCWSFSRAVRESAPVMIVVDPDVCPIIATQVGASPNEYVMRPLRLCNLLERINCLLTSRKISTSRCYELGVLDFEPIKNLVRNKNTRVSVRLTEKEKLILEMLYNAKTESVSRDSLLKSVWGYQVAISTHTLETHVYRLRKKLQIASEVEGIILTTPGGYKLQV